MSIISYSYKNDGEKFLSEHFQVKEFASFGNGKLYSDVVLIDEELISKLETLFSKLNASKCIISSGYRTKECDIAVGGSGVGQHVNGKAADCIYYDKNGSIIPSKIVICVAFDLGIFNGIANIDGNYTHLDNRQGSTYRGDEPRGNSSYWTNPYDYFGVSKDEVRKYTKEEEPKKSIEEVAQEVINGVYGNQPERQQRLEELGYNYREVQNKVNEMLGGGVKYLSNKSYTGVSIVDALNEIGVDSSFSYRSKLASANSISNYTGTAEQNTQLLNLLKNGTLKQA